MNSYSYFERGIYYGMKIVGENKESIRFFENSAPSSLNEGKYLTAKDIAFRFGISVKTIYKWVRHGHLTPERLGPRLMRFNSKEIERWISKGNQENHHVNRNTKK